MGIVLASVALGLFLGDIIILVLQDSYFYRIDEKLDSIWILLSDIYSHSDANTSGAIMSANFQALSENWAVWREGQESIRKQNGIISTIGGIGFMAGSLMIIAGKYVEAKRN